MCVGGGGAGVVKNNTEVGCHRGWEFVFVCVGGGDGHRWKSETDWGGRMQGQQGHTVVAMIRSRPQNPKLLSSTLVEGLVGLLGEWQQQREGPPQPPETDQNSNAIHHSYISPLLKRAF